MEINSKEKKRLLEAMSDSLRTIEELKVAILPLKKGEEHVLEVLADHSEAITMLLDIVFGTPDEHKNRLEKLDLVRSTISAVEQRRISKVEEKLKSYEKSFDSLKKRLTRIESRSIDRIMREIRLGNPISEKDLREAEEILSSNRDNEYLWMAKLEILFALVTKQEATEFEQEALRFADEAVSEYPNNIILWYNRGVLQFSNFDESLKSFNICLEHTKDDDKIAKHNIYFSRASLFWKAGKLEDALSDAVKSVEMKPDCSNGWSLKGNVLLDLQRIREALGCFDKAIKLDDSSTRAWFGKALCLSALGKDFVDEAILCLDKVIKLDSNDVGAYFNKATLLAREKEQYDQALEVYEEGLKIDDKDPCGWCGRGVTLNRLHRNEEALESLNKALELGAPEDCYEIFEDKIIVLGTLKRTNEIIAFLDKIAKEPKNLEELSPYILNNYAYHLYENTNRYQEALPIARKAAEKEPEEAKFHDTLACILQAVGDDNKALETFEKAVKLKKHDKDISWNSLARLYKRIGRAEEAKQAYRKAERLKKGAEHHKDMSDKKNAS